MYSGGRGDYRSGYGDYAAGDPFLGGLFRGIKRGLGVLVRTGIGFATGGIPGAIAGAVGGTVHEVSAGVGEERAAAVNDAAQGTNPGAVIRRPMMTPMGPPRDGVITESPLGTPVSPAAIARQMAMHGGVRRTHPNKSTYITRGGGTSRWPVGVQIHPKGTEAVTTRRMNVANPRALRRSLRRVAGFAKLTKRVRRAVSMAASSVGVRHRGRKTIRRR
jgi:hypothetical protein